MQKTSFSPPFIRTLSVLFIGTLLALVLARGAMLGILWPEVAGTPASDILNALYIGTKFDIRMVVLGLIPIALILGIPPLERLLVRSRGFRGLIDLLYAAVFAAATLVYIIDFGWFFYMHTRVDASLFELLGRPGHRRDDGLGKLPRRLDHVRAHRGYGAVRPVLRQNAGQARSHAAPRMERPHRMERRHIRDPVPPRLRTDQLQPLPAALEQRLFQRGQKHLHPRPEPHPEPLRYGQRRAGTRPDIEATRESYPRVAAWLRVPNPDPQKLDFMRTVPGTPAERQEKPLNVVVIIMESMTWPRTSFSPNLTGIPEDTTPNLMALSKDSLYYPLFFAPTRTTARAIFTTMTGIPDVNRSGGTSSRNQALVDQALMMNEFKGYSKYYMIGGSASWANIRGFLSHNIEGLHLLEEGSWKAPQYRRVGPFRSRSVPRGGRRAHEIPEAVRSGHPDGGIPPPLHHPRRQRGIPDQTAVRSHPQKLRFHRRGRIQLAPLLRPLARRVLQNRPAAALVRQHRVRHFRRSRP